jgi:hypothetical protein
VSIFIDVRDTNNHGVAGLTAVNMTVRYCRQGGVETSVTMSDLGALDGAYSSGGWLQINGSTMQGVYRFDPPDAALAAGADSVVFTFQSSGSIVSRSLHIALPTYSNLATAVTDDVVEAEGDITLQQAVSVILAAVAGRTSNGGLTFKTSDNAATRITAAVDASKNRTSITLNPSA